MNWMDGFKEERRNRRLPLVRTGTPNHVSPTVVSRGPDQTHPWGGGGRNFNEEGNEGATRSPEDTATCIHISLTHTSQ